MNIVEIINKKRIGLVLTKEELSFFFNGLLTGEVRDYQMSSLLMAICLNGMDDEEVFDLVDIFIKSGEVLDLSSVPGVKVDKHSTGGVGDKITLIIGPIVSSCGVVVPKMSGRGLGITGGTIDKLESIAGFKTSLDDELFIKQLKDIGFAITSQTSKLCPLDKLIYALRDVTGTTDSIPLIATSIMAKKIAGGADKIFIDIKCGSGALIKTYEDALKLKELMEKIGAFYNKQTICEISDMNTPLGNSIGNSLEVFEAIEILNGKKGKLTDFSVSIAAEMVKIAKNISLEESLELVNKVLKDGTAYKKFLEFIKYQGGNLESLSVSPYKQEIKSNVSGKVLTIDCYKMGALSCQLGAGRINKEDDINYTVGIVLNKMVGDMVRAGDILFTIYKKTDDLISLDFYDYYDIK